MQKFFLLLADMVQHSSRKQMSKVSLVVPFYNEACRFGRFRKQMQVYLSGSHPLGECILVDDGSTDKTLKLLENFCRESPIPCRALQVQPNRGKGFAVRTGIMDAREPWVLVMDADMAYLPDQLNQWIELHGLDLEAAPMPCFGSRELGIKQGLVTYQTHRRIIGRIYSLLIRYITGIRIKDTQCGFKLYPTALAREVFSKVREERFAYDVEVHYLLKKMNQPPRLLPVSCNDHGDSRVRLFHDSLQMGLALFAIRNRHRKRY
jgi:dolichyl-phosphate beta-glucosyltransferase